jgi:hypothetical protein
MGFEASAGVAMLVGAVIALWLGVGQKVIDLVKEARPAASAPSSSPMLRQIRSTREDILRYGRRLSGAEPEEFHRYWRLPPFYGEPLRLREANWRLLGWILVALLLLVGGVVLLANA